MPRDLLIIFVKAPRPGHVKTRIAEVIGPQPAAEAYLALVGILIGNLRTLPNVEVRYTPDDAYLEIPQWVQPTWKTAPQGNGDLGERLVNAFRDGFKNGVERVVIIGSDAPEISRDDIEAAWSALGDHDVVIGPAEDGGYWLIGLKSEAARLFEGITWSSSSVFEQTLDRARAAGLKVHLLRKLSDIDTIQDLRRFQARVGP
ncbi:MAG TPA: TIGR04282 family arsenosugar biosynthesis glycosyltransferase [Verrucomicrobiae bacterium]|nr:TIGR04282 family arsenosugar biosynthesis glycosyltransferase [Verrucomicrobiae bacterium]